MKTVSLERYLKSAQTTVSAGGFDFTIQRPTYAEMGGMSGERITLDWGSKFVVGWAKVKESDLLPGGDPEEVEFTTELFCQWIKDKPDLWVPIITEVLESYKRHQAEVDARGKL